jgi:hypothetical protein
VIEIIDCDNDLVEENAVEKYLKNDEKNDKDLNVRTTDEIPTETAGTCSTEEKLAVSTVRVVTAIRAKKPQKPRTKKAPADKKVLADKQSMSFGKMSEKVEEKGEEKVEEKGEEKVGEKVGETVEEIGVEKVVEKELQNEAVKENLSLSSDVALDIANKVDLTDLTDDVLEDKPEGEKTDGEKKEGEKSEGGKKDGEKKVVTAVRGKRKAAVACASNVAVSEVGEIEILLSPEESVKVQCNKDRMQVAVAELAGLET